MEASFTCKNQVISSLQSQFHVFLSSLLSLTIRYYLLILLLFKIFKIFFHPPNFLLLFVKSNLLFFSLINKELKPYPFILIHFILSFILHTLQFINTNSILSIINSPSFSTQAVEILLFTLLKIIKQPICTFFSPSFSSLDKTEDSSFIPFNSVI